ncbi:MAG: hypothetical protein JW755_02230 [Candidatus Aminicenantes bacterium]|nr:hypothetical protein [Candidatus Aminicenantes bacterium]
MIEAIIGQLSQINDLKVISRTSVVVYRNASKTPQEIAGELGVTHVLEGSIQREGEAIQSMTKAISEGTFYPYHRLINDPFYKNLRKDPRFEQIVSQTKKTHEDLSKKYRNYF